jgi:hypothetical protein
MNASDIVKAKQNKALYKAYYNPTVYTSSIISTVSVLSSIINPDYTLNNSYGSTLTTCYDYDCPRFISYEMAQNVENGKTTGKESNLEWKNTTSTFTYAYSSINTTSQSGSITTIIQVESTLIMTAPNPVICPLVQFYQGNSK